ncbi:MAG TPA: nicotinate (nicotinamide) nucleotide adenylyltransferase [Gemmatimonadaceae bacterium]|nr:nicotinate (nicotinamide) nucleotide adenylyltransferase [Gemmatimonadaceae bacterium]
MRLGIMGGSFDPPHVGHILAATDAFDALGLDRLVFVPTGIQPLKGETQQASPAARLHMVRLAVGGDARFEVDSIEIDRAGLSYSVETLTAFASRFPAAERFFLVGADVLATFQQWRHPDRIAELVEVVVLRRGDDPAGERMAAVAGARALPTRRIDVSSSEIRHRVRQGLSIRGFVPERVAEYIGVEGLYK